jgi:hypothetical protein
MQFSASGAVLLLAYGICCAPAFGQNADSAELNVDLAQCIGLESDVERFACYQERVDATLAADEPSTAAEAASNTVPVERAGTNDERQRSGDGDISGQGATEATAVRAVPDQPDESDTDEIFSTIAALREQLPDRWVITLENGQVWQMVQSKPYPLRVGLEVRLYATKWGGAYRLTVPEHGGHVQVRRAL